MSTGYLYRIKSTDAERIRSLVRETVGSDCVQVGGTLLWDVEEKPHLRSFEQASSVADLDLKGDLGHIFSAKAEVRWKRRDDGRYDVLLLTEQAHTMDDADPLGGPWTTRVSTVQVRLRRDAQGNEREPIAIRAVEFCAPNGAVQFVRYGEVKHER